MWTPVLLSDTLGFPVGINLPLCPWNQVYTSRGRVRLPPHPKRHGSFTQSWGSLSSTISCSRGSGTHVYLYTVVLIQVIVLKSCYTMVNEGPELYPHVVNLTCHINTKVTALPYIVYSFCSRPRANKRREGLLQHIAAGMGSCINKLRRHTARTHPEQRIQGWDWQSCRSKWPVFQSSVFDAHLRHSCRWE